MSSDSNSLIFCVHPQITAMALSVDVGVTDTSQGTMLSNVHPEATDK